MSNIILIKKYNNKYAVMGLFEDESTDPVGLFETYDEAVELGRKLLGEQEKQSNE